MNEEIYIVRNPERALGLRKTYAHKRPLLGTVITTPFQFIREQWDIWGNGCSLIGAHERVVVLLNLLQKAAQDCSQFPLHASVGTAKLLGAFISTYAGEAALESWITDQGALQTWPTDGAGAKQKYTQ